jgi:site-specific DNA recombinase
MIVEEFVEKQSAKIPGRPIFGQMMKRIEKVRLAVIFLASRSPRAQFGGRRTDSVFPRHRKLASLKFPSHFGLKIRHKGNFRLSMAFVQSKYYVDSLSENTKRGLRQKVRMGIFPSQAPFGYLND